MAAKRKQTQRRSASKTPAKKKANKGLESVKIEYGNEIVLVVTLMVSVLLILSHFNLCGKAGIFIKGFTFGIFGLLSYAIPYLLFIGVAFFISNKGNRTAYRKLLSGIGLLTSVAAFLELIINDYTKGTSLSVYYEDSFAGGSGGGVLGGMICNLLCPLFGVVGTYVILIAVIAILLMFLTEKLLFASLGKKSQKTMQVMKERRQQQLERRQTMLSETGDVTEELQKRKRIRPITIKGAKEKTEPSAQQVVRQEIQPEMQPETRKRVQKESKKASAYDMEEVIPVNLDDIPIFRGDRSAETVQEELIAVSEPTQRVKREKKKSEKSEEKKPEEFPEEQYFLERQMEEDQWAQLQEMQEMQKIQDMQENRDIQQKQDIKEIPRAEEAELTEKPQKKDVSQEYTQKQNSTGKQKKEETEQDSSLELPSAELPVVKEYVFPPISMLSLPKGNVKGMSDQELKETALKLKTTLDSFGVRVSVTNVSCGPAVTRYELQPEQGVKVSRITGLADDIKLNLAAEDIRIEAPIPGKAAVGIEVPNKTNTAVHLRELLEAGEFKNHSSNIAFAVGKDIGGKTIVTDIGKMPHLLIAGATGSGKSVCINTLIMSILYKANPNDVKLIMVDPKVVELSVYNGIPHLLIPVVTDPKKASAALNWAVSEMTVRYNKFAELGVRDMKGYNEKIATIEDMERQEANYQKMPQIVIIVDELADLMMVAPGEVEDAICRLAQMARAAGLHLIIATQRPSVNVITGLIKANVPSRIAFSVSSAIDSRTIIDGSGAEKLLGKGDMLFFPSGYPKPVRVQGAFVTDQEVSSVVSFLREQNEGPDNSSEIESQINSVQSSVESAGSASSGSTQDEYFVEAGKFIIEKDKASIGMLQRVYKIGFNRAARIVDQLAEAGVVGPEEGTKPRRVLMTLEEFERYIEEYV